MVMYENWQNIKKKDLCYAYAFKYVYKWFIFYKIIDT